MIDAFSMRAKQIVFAARFRAGERGTKLIDVEDFLLGLVLEVGNAREKSLLQTSRWTRLWVAKTSTATKNETVLGRDGLNTTSASTQREDFGGQEPVWVYSTHTY
jgi:hypothetical protein